jgi:hypothetical protein
VVAGFSRKPDGVGKINNIHTAGWINICFFQKKTRFFPKKTLTSFTNCEKNAAKPRLFIGMIKHLFVLELNHVNENHNKDQF